MARVLGIVGARLDSSRLPGKHLLDLAGAPLIARIFERLERIPSLDALVLATTDEPGNRPLVEWGRQAGKAVYSHSGPVEDLVGRVDAVVRRHGPEIVVYFCGDSPLIEPETVERLIRATAEAPAGTLLELAADGAGRRPVHEGFNVYSAALWRRIAEASRTPHHREHVGSVVARLDPPRRAIADDPAFYRPDHRLSVDTPSDYRFMDELYRRWYRTHGAGTIVSLKWALEELERDPALAAINAEVKQKGVTERSARVVGLLQAGRDTGLGHLSRMAVAAAALQDFEAAGVYLLVQGEAAGHPALDLLPHRFLAPGESQAEALGRAVEAQGADAVLLDLARPEPELAPLLERLGESGVARVAIDGPLRWADRLDYLHIPSFHLDPAHRELAAAGGLGHGWDHYLIDPRFRPAPLPGGGRVVVLSGGSDAHALGRTWPALLDARLPERTELVWVQGPLAPPPELPGRPRLCWRVEHAPADLPGLTATADAALVLYGVSLFELLQQGRPCVTWSPDRGLAAELEALAGEGVAEVAATAEEAVERLARLLAEPERAAALAASAVRRLRPGEGGRLLARRLMERVEALR